MVMKKMTGKVTKVNAGSKTDPDTSGELNPHSYVIQDQEGNTYLAHMGDIGENEGILIQASRENRLERLNEGDTVEFEPVMNQNRAIQVIIKATKE